jgi:hypothetical protein
VLVVTFFAGVQLLSLGVMGEYVGRIYDEVKRRPKYIIHKQVNLAAPEPAAPVEPAVIADPVVVAVPVIPRAKADA